MEKNTIKKAKPKQETPDIGNGQFDYDTPFTLVIRGTPSNREMGRKATTLNQELEKAREHTAHTLLWDMIMNRWLAVEENLRGLVYLMINELDEHGVPTNRYAQNGKKATSMFSPEWIEFFDDMLTQLDELESSNPDKEPVEKRQPYKSWRLRLGKHQA